LDSRNGNQLKFVTIPADDSENPQGILTACRYKWYLFLYDSGSETLSALEVSINQMLKEKP